MYNYLGGRSDVYEMQHDRVGMLKSKKIWIRN